MEKRIELTIRLLSPPPSVQFCVQKGKSELEQLVTSSGEDIEFTIPFRVKQKVDGSPNFLGEYAQGTPKQRFFYLCIGQAAGQITSEWTRRVKIHLSGITWVQVEKISSNSKLKLTASYEATNAKGEPSCASVPLTNGWVVGL